MSRLNYSHLLYFHTIVKEGGVGRAAQALNLSPQTISGQLHTFEETVGYPLFERRGKRLVLNQRGRQINEYAEKIFCLGSELESVLKEESSNTKTVFSVGVTDVVPKSLISSLLNESLEVSQNRVLVCREGGIETLLEAMNNNELDIIISDQQLNAPLDSAVLSYCIGRTGSSFLAAQSLTEQLQSTFPESLHNAPFLMPGKNSAQRIHLISWFEKQQIRPNILAEFDDTALMLSFAHSGHGVFCTPSIVEVAVKDRFELSLLGRTAQIEQQYFAILPQRQHRNPYTHQVIARAEKLFSSADKSIV